MNFPTKITDKVTVDLTAEELVELHNKLTDFYNDHYEEITKITNPD